MATLRDVPVANLALDLLNPRFDEQANQADALRTVIAQQGEKLVNLAEDIVEEGIDPSSLTIVLPDEADKQRLIVLEGNRRLTALRVLSNPDLAKGLLPPTAERRLGKMSALFAERPVTLLMCVVVADRDEANHWIELRHRGQMEGRGIVEWDGQQSARFEARNGVTGRNSAAAHAIELVRELGKVDDETRSQLDQVRITTLQRVLNDPDVRRELGVEIQGGRLVSDLPETEALKGLSRLIRDAARGDLPVSRVDTKGLRAKYIREFRQDELPSKTAKRGDLKALDAPIVPVPSQRAPSKRRVGAGGDRRYLIPKTSRFNIDEAKIDDIYRELRRLPVEEFRNAVAVLLRVFLELSVDTYLARHRLMPKVQLENSKLKDKLLSAANKIEADGAMTKQELKPIRNAADPQHLLVASITTMHGYVHNAKWSPAVSDLRSIWQTFEPFLLTIWK